MIDQPELLPTAAERFDLRAPVGGTVRDIDPLAVGRAGVLLRAGRATREAEIDPGAGVSLRAIVGEQVGRGDRWATMHFGSGANVEAARSLLDGAIRIGDDAVAPSPLIIERHA